MPKYAQQLPMLHATPRRYKRRADEKMAKNYDATAKIELINCFTYTNKKMNDKNTIVSHATKIVYVLANSRHKRLRRIATHCFIKRNPIVKDAIKILII